MRELPLHRTAIAVSSGAAAILVSAAAFAQPAIDEGPLATEPRSVELDRIAERSSRERGSLFAALLAGGAAEAGYGVAMFASDVEDQAGRVAGSIMAIFGATNALIGGLALWSLADTGGSDAPDDGQSRGSGPTVAELLADESSSRVVFAVNLGLDVAYMTAGAFAVAAPELGASHPERWRWAGAAMLVSAVYLMAVDVIGLVQASAREQQALELVARAVDVSVGLDGVSVSVGSVF